MISTGLTRNIQLKKNLNSDMNTEPILELGRRNRLVMVLGGGWQCGYRLIVRVLSRLAPEILRHLRIECYRYRFSARVTMRDDFMKTVKILRIEMPQVNDSEYRP